ncbi:hypothetical protein DPMN_186538 [Dreissena polymorpha]|uniref:Uncharacterized protein n=1 Tax=Dreissena polymorpha TaxID=45954 RepID=A0A9D4I6L2_DREPO|nr:hypothetical protein DPMN_186538 [Dreissena polymorpha]
MVFSAEKVLCRLTAPPSGGRAQLILNCHSTLTPGSCTFLHPQPITASYSGSIVVTGCWHVSYDQLHVLGENWVRQDLPKPTKMK